MRILGEHHQALTFDAGKAEIRLLDQTRLPFEHHWLTLDSLDACCHAIAHMQVRGAPAIGVLAAYAMAIATRQGCHLPEAARALKATRPTAVNLAWAVDRSLAAIDASPGDAYKHACDVADDICRMEIAACEAIAGQGATLVRGCADNTPAGRVNILTHCNAGWLATVDWGTALAPVYQAVREGIDVHVWVDATGPRYQGARLTMFELQHEGIDCTLVCDNAGGLLMQQGQVDLCLVGSDRTVANGDVCNKVGTYLKALAAFDNNVPFYVALPASTIDWAIPSGAGIPIEQRHADEVLYVTGHNDQGEASRVRIAPHGSQAANPAFDITPARLVTGLVTEHGIYSPTPEGMRALRQACQTSALANRA